MNLSQAQNARRDRGLQHVDDLLEAQINELCDGINFDGPGSAKRVTPEARKKLKGIIDHYAHAAHPFRECVKDNTKRFGPEAAKHVCGVIKALGKSPKAKVGLAQACPVQQMDKECFDALHAISQTDYMAVIGREA